MARDSFWTRNPGAEEMLRKLIVDKSYSPDAARRAMIASGKFQEKITRGMITGKVDRNGWKAISNSADTSGRQARPNKPTPGVVGRNFPANGRNRRRPFYTSRPVAEGSPYIPEFSLGSYTIFDSLCFFAKQNHNWDSEWTKK